jgi:hypothetical protein
LNPTAHELMRGFMKRGLYRPRHCRRRNNGGSEEDEL